MKSLYVPALRLKKTVFLGLSFVLLIGILATLPSWVKADVPLAARVLEVPYNDTQNGGLIVQVSNLSGLKAISNDGTTIYLLNTSGNIVTMPTSQVTGSPGTTVNATGTVHTVGWGIGGAPSFGVSDGRSLAYSHGCLFISDDYSSSPINVTIKLYCIDVSDWSVTEIAVPGGKPLPEGQDWGRGTMIDFVDGRIGKVSKYEEVGPGDYTSYLRMYTVTGTGKNASIAWSQDYQTHDTEDWNTDEHGVATDGTYLYRIQFAPSALPSGNFKSWPLAESGAPDPVYAGLYTQPPNFNVTYLSHDHINNRYMFGQFNGNRFYATPVADPGPGPGNPLTPTFGAITRTARGFTVQVTNYDATFDWVINATNGSVSISGSGLVTVTGLSKEQFSAITVSTSKTNFPNGSAQLTGQALGDDLNGDGVTDSDQDNVTVTTNTTTGKTVVVEVDDACSLSDVSARQAGDFAKDSDYTYPLGLIDFTADCGTPGFTSTIKQYYYNPPSDTFVLRKFVDSKYTTVSGATMSMQTIHGQQVLVIVYEVTDGGSLDDDGIQNGVIVDPAGPAALIASNSSAAQVGVPNTGLAPESMLQYLVATIIGGGFVLGQIPFVRRSTYALLKKIK